VVRPTAAGAPSNHAETAPEDSSKNETSSQGRLYLIGRACNRINDIQTKSENRKKQEDCNRVAEYDFGKV
jgi:hypothetical protein